jgi:DinB family protein
MDALQSATSEFSTILELAAAQLPLLTDTAAHVDGHWSRKQILGHLIDSAANNHQRFVRGQHVRELVTQGYAQEQWVETERFNDREWNDLVQFWLAYNRHLLHLMSHVSPERLQSIIRIGSDDPVSLEFVMIDYVRHMKHHLKQIGVQAAIE